MKNQSVSLDLLNLPSNITVSGQIRSKTSFTILQTTTVDQTNVEVTTNLTTGKKTAKRVTKTTVEYSSVPTTTSFGAYGLNLLSSYVNSFGYTITNVGADGLVKLEKPLELKPISTGEMAGQMVYFGGSNAAVTPTAKGWDFEVSGFAPGVPITVMRKSVSITGTVNISANGNYTVSNVSKSTVDQRNTNMTLDQLKTASGLSETDLFGLSKTVFHIENVDDNTNVIDIAALIDIDGNKYKGQVYINGIVSQNIPYTNLNASFGKKFPQFVQRWRLYNGDIVNEKVYGSTWLRQMQHSDSSEITIIAGDKFSWDESTKTLTYDSSKETHLWYQFECLPAQGKNEGWEYIIDLRTGKEVTRK